MLSEHFPKREKKSSLKSKTGVSYFFFESEDEDEMEFEKIVLVDEGGGRREGKQTLKVQGIRSACGWSMGLPADQIEASIQKAYLNSIEKAEHFIYIENQFFISRVDKGVVENKIVSALAKRVERAIKEGKEFMVFLTLPLLPGFGGDITKKDGQVLRIGVEWHLNTLFKGSRSLVNRIEKAQDDADQEKDWRRHLRVFGLRKHEVINGKPSSEIVYVHSKLLVADDKLAICGSANINDRSLLGNRDSELAVVIEDEALEKGILAGKETDKSDVIRNLRIDCFKSIFGIETDYEDPLDPDFLAAIDKQCEINGEFFWKAFKFYPHNDLKTLKQIEELDKELNIDYYYENRDKVIGIAQHWPLMFLVEEKSLVDKFLDIGTTLLPQTIFT